MRACMLALAACAIVASCKRIPPSATPNAPMYVADGGDAQGTREKHTPTTGGVDSHHYPLGREAPTAYEQSHIFRDPGPPGTEVRILSAEVYFRHWPPAPCGGPECSLAWPEDLRTSYYRKRQRVQDPTSVDMLWRAYKAVRSSAAIPPSKNCQDDARIMVVFSTTEPAERWVAAGQTCRVLMVTDDYQLHEKDAVLLRELADTVGVSEELEKADPDIWLNSGAKSRR